MAQGKKTSKLQTKKGTDRIEEVKVTEKDFDRIFNDIVGRLYDETAAIRGSRVVKPETFTIQIGMDE